MKTDITIKGIKTNNLRDISVSLKKNSLNLIVGPSGSGKSSLAYDTIAQIGAHELGSMYNDGANEPEYLVDSYSNMVVTVPIQQLNTNNNVRSTIGTYFGISTCLAKIYSSLLNLPYDYFVLNTPGNICPACSGVGYTKKLDVHKIVDYDKTVEDVPIRCWKKGKDFYCQILISFCKDNNIPTKESFRHLSEQQQKAILYSISAKKYKIKYKTAGVISTRTTPYYGPMNEMAMLKNFSPSSEFYSEVPCQDCSGEKFETNHRKHELCGYSIGEIMLQPFEKVSAWIEQLKKDYDCSLLDFSISQIRLFSEKAVELKLGYLFFNRTIPSLSGGELQRLRLIQVFNTQLTDLLVVLDEPLAGLSNVEKNSVYNNIINLKKKHSLLVVDHHDIFIHSSENIIALGSGGGKNGGRLVDSIEYLNKQSHLFPFDVLAQGHRKKFSSKNSVYHYKGFELELAVDGLNLILGSSGIGKSTLLREYFPQVFDDYLYVNQKPLNGNVRSTVATAIGIADIIIRLYAKYCKQDKSMFSNTASAKGACTKCSGTGIIVFGAESQSQITMTCKSCKGTGFDKRLQKHTIDGKSILDVWMMTVDEAELFFKSIDKRIHAVLQNAQKLLLGHLQLGEKTKNLSGGENVRVKLLVAMSTPKKIIGLDEPFKGLNSTEIYSIALLLNDMVKCGKTIIVIDHEEMAQRYFSHRITLTNKNGYLREINKE